MVLGTDPVDQIDSVVDHLVKTRDQWDLVDLQSLRETGNARALIERSLSRTKLPYRILAEQPCPYLPIDAPWQEIVKRFCPHVRHNLRTQQNRLERMRADGLRVRIITNPQGEDGLLDKLVALKSPKCVQGKLMAPFFARYAEVFQSLFDTLGPHGWIYFALIERGDRSIA